LQLEQQRLDMIVSAAGRGMISVRSTRGSTGYYDQGFAAALAQHLEQTTSFPEGLSVTLPPAPSRNSKETSSVVSSPSTAEAASSPFSEESGEKLNHPSKSYLYSCLSRPHWSGIALGPGDGLAGCSGESPSAYMDNVAESLLDATLPTKQQLFAGVKPMVENLL
jgi:hypothetical protein